MVRNSRIEVTKRQSGSRNHVTTDPRHIKEIIDEIIESGQLFNTVFPHSELDIVLKLLTRKPGRLNVGECLQGAIVHDDEYHYTFIEDEPQGTMAAPNDATTTDARNATATGAPVATEKKGTRVKRNPIVIPGNCVNLHRKGNGSFYPTFRYPELTEHYTWNSFCIEAAKEILSLTGLIEEKRNPDN